MLGCLEVFGVIVCEPVISTLTVRRMVMRRARELLRLEAKWRRSEGIPYARSERL